MSEADLTALERCLQRVVAKLASEPAPISANLERGIVLPILQALGWDIFDTSAVQSSFPGSGAHVDLTLCDEHARPHVLLEVSGSRPEPDAANGVLLRARRNGVSLVVRTNGPAWRMFLAALPAESRTPVFDVDLTKAEVAEAASSLCRFLGRNRVLTGASVKDAIAANALPAAWRALDHRDFTVVKEALVWLLGELEQRSAGFLEQCSPHPVFHAKKRCYLARSPRDLFPDRPDLEHHHAGLPSGWFLNTNTNTNTMTKEKQARCAVEVAGLQLGVDVTVDFRSP